MAALDLIGCNIPNDHKSATERQECNVARLAKSEKQRMTLRGVGFRMKSCIGCQVFPRRGVSK